MAQLLPAEAARPGLPSPEYERGTPAAGRTPVTMWVDGEPVYGTLYEPTPATVTLSGFPVGFPHGSFLQATADGERILVEAVQETMGGATAVADEITAAGGEAIVVVADLRDAAGAASAVSEVVAAFGGLAAGASIAPKARRRHPDEAPPHPRCSAGACPPPVPHDPV